jgi:hypothetical protein
LRFLDFRTVYCLMSVLFLSGNNRFQRVLIPISFVQLFTKAAGLNKGNNKITELRTILQRESQNPQAYKQTKSVNNRKTVKTVMTLTWYRHFQRNGGLNQILKRQTSPFHYGSKFPAVTITVFTTILEQNR